MARAAQSVHSLLIPIEGKNLVLPNAAVAEIIGYREPEVPDSDPDWLLGWFDWRDQRVPLVAIESVAGETRPSIIPSARIAVLNGVGGHPELPFFAIVTQGIPRLARIDGSAIAPAGQEAGKAPGVLMSVLVYGEPAVIPDLDALEGLLLEQVGSNSSR